MRSLYDHVGDFHRKFGLEAHPSAEPPALLPDGPGALTVQLVLRSVLTDYRALAREDDDFAFRVAFLLEELVEFMDAHRRGDLAEAADALVDLVYVALGTAHLMRLPFDALFAEVQRANLAKERAAGADDARSKRGHRLDVVKPAGWRGPDLERVLRDHVYVNCAKDPE